MPDETPVYHIPYPVGTDRVMDGDDSIAGVAWAVEAIIRVGQATITTNEVGAAVIVPDPVLRSTPSFVALTYMNTPDIGAVVLKWMHDSTSSSAIYLQVFDAASNPIVGLTFLVAWFAICP